VSKIEPKFSYIIPNKNLRSKTKTIIPTTIDIMVQIIIILTHHRI